MRTVATCSILTATAVITDSHHRFSKRWHVADVKNIACDDQTTLMVHQNSANLACTFRIYVCLRLCDRDCCSAADGSGSCHAPAPSYFEEITRCLRQILQWRWPGIEFPQFRFVYVYTIATDAPAAALRLMAASGDRSNGMLPMSKTCRRLPGSIEIPQIRKFMPTRSSKAFRKTSFCCYERRRDWRHCAPFTLLLSLVTVFAFTFWK